MFNLRRSLNDLQLFHDFPKPLPRREVNKDPAGELLIEFFDYYSRFDFTENAISIKRGTVFSRTELSERAQNFKLFIEDPFSELTACPTVKRLDNLQKIQQAFTNARNSFLGFCAKGPFLSNIHG
ncbi:unnamed protein product [Gongylonema pulchrum]|uniref:PAP-associated domain-containing protein n=1 Tax=Gongylonema pulchrum TaxID=637853 RepID=A0A183E958_9BILA|nr:unnamed protein product [Gongylonema pulchrum]